MEASSPEGTVEGALRNDKSLEVRILSAVPSGLGPPAASIPALKRRAIFINAFGIPGSGRDTRQTLNIGWSALDLFH